MATPIARRLGERCKTSQRAEMFDAKNCITEVRVLDISTTGARIEVAPGESISRQFEIRISRNGEKRAAEVVWRNGREAPWILRGAFPCLLW